MKISDNARRQFEYFAQCQDVKRLPEIRLAPMGRTALECFHLFESTGKLVPCREPELLSRALNGKAQHGMTVTMLAEDYLGRIFLANDLVNYPEWVQHEILTRARQIAQQTLGFVPKFVETGRDFTVLGEEAGH